MRKEKHFLYNLSGDSTRSRIFQKILNGFHSNERLSLRFFLEKKKFFFSPFFYMSGVQKDLYCYRVKYFSFNRAEFFWAPFRLPGAWNVYALCFLSALESLRMPRLHIDSYQIFYISLYGWKVVDIVIVFSFFFLLFLFQFWTLEE